MKKHSLVLRSSVMEHFTSCTLKSVPLSVLYSAVPPFGNDPCNFVSPNHGGVALENPTWTVEKNIH